MIFDTKGHLYGTTLYGGSGACNDGLLGTGCETVFELTPQAGGHWLETIPHDFNNNGTDGIFPYSSPTLDSVGNLFGTTNLGGGYNSGTVYEIRRP
ncbi:MAG: choice-of-anchor tandem repeat GloVer-containing protein [Candidatus Sulfotelmatobacter sp.]